MQTDRDLRVNAVRKQLIRPLVDARLVVRCSQPIKGKSNMASKENEHAANSQAIRDTQFDLIERALNSSACAEAIGGFRAFPEGGMEYIVEGLFERAHRDFTASRFAKAILALGQLALMPLIAYLTGERSTGEKIFAAELVTRIAERTKSPTNLTSEVFSMTIAVRSVCLHMLYPVYDRAWRALVETQRPWHGGSVNAPGFLESFASIQPDAVWDGPVDDGQLPDIVGAGSELVNGTSPVEVANPVERHSRKTGPIPQPARQGEP